MAISRAPQDGPVGVLRDFLPSPGSSCISVLQFLLFWLCFQLDVLADEKSSWTDYICWYTCLCTPDTQSRTTFNHGRRRYLDTMNPLPSSDQSHSHIAVFLSNRGYCFLMRQAISQVKGPHHTCFSAVFIIHGRWVRRRFQVRCFLKCISFGDDGVEGELFSKLWWWFWWWTCPGNGNLMKLFATIQREKTSPSTFLSPMTNFLKFRRWATNNVNLSCLYFFRVSRLFLRLFG